MSSLNFSSVSVRLGSGRHALTAVEQVDLLVPSGTVLGLVGESGSGKSTLGRAAVGLARTHSGQILLDGIDIANATRSRRSEQRRVQMIFQDPYSSLDPRMTVRETLTEAARANRHTPRREYEAEVDRVLQLVHLDSERIAPLFPNQLSGGQRQRIAIARALAAKPDVIVADEITSALDVSVQGAVLNLVRDLQRKLGLTILFISHDLSVVRYLSDIVAVMHLGRIVEVAPVHQLLTDPRHPYTRELLKSVPRVGGSLASTGSSESKRALDQEPPDPHAPPSGCPFHTRCPVGPLVLADRERCLHEDPHSAAAGRVHKSACHFSDDPRPFDGSAPA